ncbi:Imm52 family immunity protein [Haliangium sp.]|uniref:Imm52 family immunity protein n=1 Tax=Haliangium sp. TaxID=2663208 RepID=UPI003D11FBB5
MLAVAYWAARREGSEQCAERLARFMGHLGQISPHLGSWYETGVTRRAAMQAPIEPERIRLRDLVDAGRHRDDTPRRRVIDDLGFHVEIWSGDQPDGNDASLSILCGAYSPHGACNHIIIELPADWLDTDSAVGLIRSMVSCWSPTHAAVCSPEALDAVGGQAVVPVIDWVFFHRRPRQGQLRAPSRVAFELDGGECIVVQDTPVRPDHVHERARVRELAKQLGLLETPSQG